MDTTMDTSQVNNMMDVINKNDEDVHKDENKNSKNFLFLKNNKRKKDSFIY